MQQSGALLPGRQADAPIERVTLVKNERDYMFFLGFPEKMIFDYRRERSRDCYYLRVLLSDGRMAWSSPIWIESGTPEAK